MQFGFHQILANILLQCGPATSRNCWYLKAPLSKEREVDSRENIYPESIINGPEKTEKQIQKAQNFFKKRTEEKLRA